MKNKSIKTYILGLIKERYKSHSKFKPSIYWADFAKNFRLEEKDCTIFG